MSEQPHNTELEQQILGAILTDNKFLEGLAEVPPDIFMDPVHQAIFSTMRDKVLEGETADATTLRFRMAHHEGLAALGGAEYLLRLQSSAVGTSMMGDYTKELRRLYARRCGIGALELALSNLTRDDGAAPEEVLETAESGISEALQAVQTKPLARSWLSGMFDAVSQINDAYQNERMPGVSTGLTQLDKQIGAMGAGEYLLLGGRPAMGKTALAFNIAVKSALRGEGVFFGSLEMVDAALAMRGLSQIIAGRGEGIPYSDMRKGNLTPEQMERVLGVAREMERLPIYTCDPSCRSLPRLRGAIQAGARHLKAAGTPLKLIVVDYLQLIDPVGRYRAGDTNGRVTAASAAMKAIAMHYGVPLLCLSQLSRNVETRDPPVPTLSDLRDSGSIEQDADVVWFAYRPEYYTGRKIQAAKGAGGSVSQMADLEAQITSQRDRMTIITAKYRAGATGAVTVYCDIKNNVVADRAPENYEMEGF